MMLMGLVCNSCSSCKMGSVFLLGSYINKWYGGYDCGGSQVFVGGLNWNCWTFFFWFIRGEFLWYIYIYIDLYPNVLLSYLFGWVSNHAIHNPWSWVSWSWLSMKLSSQESSTFFIYLFISCNVNIHLILGSH
jgi:hypothetical protein